MSKSVNNMFLKKTILAGALAGALGASVLPQSALATVYTFSFAGGNGNVFTMLNSGGPFVANSDGDAIAPWFTNRTPINGTITYDTTPPGSGSMVINPFSFFGSGVAIATTITFQAIGDGIGGPGNLMLGNMGFNWNGNNGIPVSIVWDATGFLAAVNGAPMSPGDTITGAGMGGALPASNNTDDTAGAGGTTFPIGSALMATTTSNTTNVDTDAAGLPNPIVLGDNPSGTLPLISDAIVDTTNSDTGIGGSPMRTAPFSGFNANFDFTNLLVTCVDADCGQGIVTDTTPDNGAPADARITVTFSTRMTVSTVINAITLVDVTNSNAPIVVTVTPNTTGSNNATYSDTFTISFAADQNLTTPAVDMAYDTTYRATLDNTNVLDESSNPLDPSPNNTWTWTIGSIPPIQVCQSGVIGSVPLGSNFSMLDAAGRVFGGTNDIAYDFGNGPNNGHDPALLNTLVSGTPGANGTLGIATNTMASTLPHPFFGAVWTAHHIRLFGPGTYSINTECSTTDLENGACTLNANPAKNLTMTVGAGKIGAHMLFDWNGNLNIDVVNVWSQNAAWTDPDVGDKNNLWTGTRWLGPSGYTVNPPTLWSYVSTDSDGDGENGVKMIDGPFQKFSANFNLGPADSCQSSPPTTIAIEDTKKVGGCSLGAGNVDLTERGDWWLVAGFLAWLGLIRKRLARQRS